MKYRGTLERKNFDNPFETQKVEVFEFEEISREKAQGKMRTILRDYQEAGVIARLFEIHRADADFIVRWDIDSNLITRESFKV